MLANAQTFKGYTVPRV